MMPSLPVWKASAIALGTSASASTSMARLNSILAVCSCSAATAIARAESRRAMAVAAEQEQTAKIELSRAMLVDAEAEVPRAMAEAFQTGKLGIMDYYKMRNVQADTAVSYTHLTLPTSDLV